MDGVTTHDQFENQNRKTLMARGIVLMLILSTLMQIFSQTLVENSDNVGESMEPTEQPKQMYAQTYDVGNHSSGGYHLASGEWWEPQRPIEVTSSDWDGDGTSNSQDDRPLDPAIPIETISSCTRTIGDCTSDRQGFDTRSSSWESQQSTHDAKAIAAGDIDGDGDLDLAIGFFQSGTTYGSGGSAKVYLNEDGVLTSTPYWSSSSMLVQDLAWGDIDGDGDVDLAVATYYSNYVFLNDGDNLSSTANWTSSDSLKTRAISLGDIDGDGDLDLVVGNGHSHSSASSNIVNQVFFNNAGTLSTTAGWSSSDKKKTFDIELGDLDDDGDLDMVVANYGGDPQIFLNSGSGLSTSASSWSPSSNNHWSIALGDVDGDGLLDVALGKTGYTELYYNSASGLSESANWTGGASHTSMGIALGDVDADGDLDLVEANGMSAMQEATELYINRDGVLDDDSSWSPFNNAETNDLIWADFDGDGLLDLARANAGEPAEIFMNKGSTIEKNHGWESGSSGTVYNTDWGDIDGDGDLDLAFGNTVYLQKDGVISSSPDWTGGSGSGTDVEWVDIDDDGDLDLAIGRNGANVIYFNTGTNLSTTAGWTSSDSKDTDAIEFGDVDNDGDLDLVVGNKGAVNQVFFNSGSGLSTTAGWSSSDSKSTVDISLGDINGDGDLDLVSGNQNQYTQAFYGTGSTFSTTASWTAGYWSTSTYATKTYSVHIADFNNDGDLDLFEGNWGAKDLIFLNSGSGLPTTGSMYVGDANGRTYGSGIADVDSDGDIDISIALDMNADLLYINNGDGDFSLAWEGNDTTNSEDHTYADVNGDSLLDLTIASRTGEGDPVQIYYGISDRDRDWYSDSNDDLDYNPTQYSDVDGDGHGDTSSGWSPDDCTGYWGDSWRDRTGCPDEDGDGQSNLNDDFWRKDTQWLDTDGDGLGDNWGNSSWDASRSSAWPGQYMASAYLQDPNPLDYDNDGFEDSALSGAVTPFDNCPFVYGLSTEDLSGCPDSDGDGYSDSSDSHSGDQTQWSDTDNDGYGDNWADGAWNQSRAGGVGEWVQGASNPDNCPTTWGNSTADFFGCTDNDGDGYSSLTDVDDNDGSDWNDADNDGFGDNADQCPFTWGNITLLADKGCPDADADGYADRSDDLPNDATQWIDSDGDGYGENMSGNTPDACKDDRGTSTRGISAGANTSKYGCADSDSDSYANTDDPCPFSYGNSWVDRFGCPDSDQDGISNNVDPYPNSATSDIEDWDDDGYLDHSSGSNTDAFPTDNTQNSDTDGDGYGDNPNGNFGDQFLNQATQWQDSDGDGYGDNQSLGSFEPDRCPSTYGNSTIDRFGCTDTDGDGYSDATPGYFSHPQGLADSHPNDDTQYRDRDGDGYGDNSSGTLPDSCDMNYGISTLKISSSGLNQTWYGCPDTDGDSYEDQTDPCKNQFGNSWVDQMGCPDSDQDGISDEADPYPNTATSSIDDWDDDGVINSNDDFPADRTQSQDTDGDGYGDNPLGNYPDAFVNEITQWSDLDGDGFGDNSSGLNADDCSYTSGNSTQDRLGCPDSDGDGWSNPDGAWTSVYGADAFIDEPSQWRDDDGDGYGDNVSGSNPDDCPKQSGTSTMKVMNGLNATWLGCIDTDGDEYYDASDPCPFQFGNSWVDRMGCPDSDQDGISDSNDPYPDDATNSTDDYDGDGIANDLDDFPADRTQTMDTDGDGYGDDPNGSYPDAFPAEQTQWQDSDNDGYGDNSDGIEPDGCIYESGNSTSPVYGCTDTDGDGVADDYDDFPRDVTRQSDQDGDGYSDDGDTNQTDDCPHEFGDSTLGELGCPDSDGDGWSNNDDECPEQYGNSGEPFTGCPDRDGDGIADVSDAYPDDAFENNDSDGDGIGDNSDIYPDDYDNDGYSSSVDWDDYDSNEWNDTDGDGVGDNSDPWPDNPALWSDMDGDGYADQTGSILSDNCITTVGNSTLFQQGCPDLDGDGMPDVLDSDIDGDGVTNDNEMDASNSDVTYDPFNYSSKPADLDGDNVPDILDFDIDNDGFPNDFEEERGSDISDENSTPFNVYGDQTTGFFYTPGEGFSSQYDPDGYEISLSLIVKALTTEFLIPIIMIPMTFIAIRRKKRRYKKIRARLTDLDNPKALDDVEEMIDRLILNHKVSIEHGVLLRNLYERKKEELLEVKPSKLGSTFGSSRGGPGGGGGRRDLASKRQDNALEDVDDGMRMAANRPGRRRVPSAGRFGLDSDRN